MKPNTALTTAPAAGALLVALGLAGFAPGAAAESRVFADQFLATYPTACAGAAVTGLCLLGATRPAAIGDFRVGAGAPAEDDPPVPLNTNIALAPGDYILYQQSGLDRYRPHYFTVTAGKITTVQTTTVKFQNGPGRLIKLQHWQSTDGIDGAGCEAEIGNAGVHALLPGLYQATLVASAEEDPPTCERGGVAFFAGPGEGLTLRTGTAVESPLTPANTYTYRSGGAALTSVDPQLFNVTSIGILPRFQSYQGIHMPSSARVSGLVLSGPPGFHFVFPFKVGSGADCGVSLHVEGIPPRLLLSQCQFDPAGTLTGFRLNAGTYFGLDNLHTKTGMAGHAINSPVVVRNASFNLRGK
ncbi:hypothetical protein [Candidatus Thiodictyon syntrophicum]|uniref:Uncharacterized protein n=1 Tax=Candidatus Thiodictyon syntrophicum TaxID=1166950 RepID=A0A2K8U9I4_9GAMM|nr:hypothetical protein [Candidatus Thiodictyon syntrophicum]AUB82069.1 hypothetical protein THSYN_14680 [Candidatus Thiodictyon syntrophicum]